MATLAIPAPGRTCDLHLLYFDRHNLQSGSDHKKIKLASGRLALSTFNHQASL